MQTCSYCGRENTEVSTHCKECGTQLPFALQQPVVTESPAKPRKAIFGVLSLLVLGAAVFAFIRISRVPPGVHGEGAFGGFVVAVMISCYISIPSLFLAVIGLMRGERPRWPAIVGTTLSAFPALGGVYIACGAPL